MPATPRQKVDMTTDPNPAAPAAPLDLHGAFHVYDTTLRDGAQREHHTFREELQDDAPPAGADGQSRRDLAPPLQDWPIGNGPLGLGPPAGALLPHAHRDRTITSASSSARYFFMCFPPLDLF